MFLWFVSSLMFVCGVVFGDVVDGCGRGMQAVAGALV